MRRHRTVPLLAVLLAPLFVATACNKRELDPSGPYGGDTFLWAADGVIEDFDRIITEVEGWAARNPAIAASERFEPIVAKISLQRDGIVDRSDVGAIASHEVLAWLITARDAYKAARTTDNADELNDKLTLARALLEEARRLLVTGGTPQ